MSQIQVEMLKENKFLSLALITQKVAGKERKWVAAIRGGKEDVKRYIDQATRNEWNQYPADGVNILLYFRDSSGTLNFVIALENRVLANGWVFSTPAGLVELGLSERETAEKETMEETGGKIVPGSLKLSEPAFTTVGLTPERLTLATAEIESLGEMKLEDSEMIKRAVVPFDDMTRIMNGEKLPLKDVNGETLCDNDGKPILNYFIDLKARASIEPMVEREKARIELDAKQIEIEKLQREIERLKSPSGSPNSLLREF